MPTYQPNIPLSSNLISNSQQDLNNNFTQLNSSWNVDHIPFNNTGNGQHAKVTLSAPITDPNQITPIASLYTQASPTTITSDLYYQDGALASNVKQLTGGGISAGAWCVFDGTLVNPPAISAYNVSSITRAVNSNNYVINFTRSFTGANYAVSVTPSLNTTLPIAIQITPSASSCSITIRTNGSGTSGGSYISMLFFGKLA